MSGSGAKTEYRRWGPHQWWRVGRMVVLGMVGLAAAGCAVHDADYPRYRYYGDHRVLIQSGPPLLHASIHHTSRSYRPVHVHHSHPRAYRRPIVRPYTRTHVRRSHPPHRARPHRVQRRPGVVHARPPRPAASRPHRATRARPGANRPHRATPSRPGANRPHRAGPSRSAANRGHHATPRPRPAASRSSSAGRPSGARSPRRGRPAAAAGPQRSATGGAPRASRASRPSRSTRAGGPSHSGSRGHRGRR